MNETKAFCPSVMGCTCLIRTHTYTQHNTANTHTHTHQMIHQVAVEVSSGPHKLYRTDTHTVSHTCCSQYITLTVEQFKRPFKLQLKIEPKVTHTNTHTCITLYLKLLSINQSTTSPEFCHYHDWRYTVACIQHACVCPHNLSPLAASISQDPAISWGILMQVSMCA